ncbi:MAG: OFA family MFS transporter [Candidatus Lokiarchaeota archaeon]|nr:OFA family MFS transporter [Candidatus Lokiarchaeota archaeon]
MSTEQKVRNRWIVVIGAILIQLALGTIYSWGTMTVFVSPYLNLTMSLDPNIVREVTVYIFGVGLLTFAITMIFAGKLQQKYGPKKIAILGGILIGIGLILSAFMPTFIGLLITYGIIFGAGIGFGYVCPIASAGKWFPDKKGFINGIAVAGFGAGAFVFNYVIKALANPTGLSDTAPNFVDVISPNIPIMFIVLGIIYIVLVIGGAMTLSNPPEGWKPDGWTPPPPSEESGISGLEFERGQTVKLPQFWMLWAAFALSAMSGLMVIGSFSAFAKTYSSPSVFKYIIGTSDFVLIGSLAALFNGLGRIVWGKLADMITYKKTMLVMFTTQAILMFIYFTTNVSELYFLVVTCAIFFCFGGNFSLFPTATADLFGSKNLGPNYGIVFTAYGVAGFIGAVGVNLFVSIFGSYLILFIVMGAMSVGSAILAFILKPPKQR